jgi:phage tail protein X
VKWTDIFEDTICYRLYLHFLAIFQVPPAELEHILHTNPEIADAAVVPYVSTALINRSSVCVQKQIRSCFRFSSMLF